MGFWQSHQRGVLPTWVLLAFLVTYGLASVGLYAQEGFSTNTIGALGAGVIWVSLVLFNKVTWCFWLSVFGAVAGSIGGLALITASGLNSPVGLFSLGYISYCVFWPFFFRQYVPRKIDDPGSLVSSAVERTQIATPYSYEGGAEKSTDTASESESYSEDDYERELDLFEKGELSKPLWSKHLVEAEGDTEKAKWRYIKERVAGAPERRASQAKLALEKQQKADKEILRRTEEAERHANKVVAENQKRLDKEELERERALKLKELNKRLWDREAAREESSVESRDSRDKKKSGGSEAGQFVLIAVAVIILVVLVAGARKSEERLQSQANDLLRQSQQGFYGFSGDIDEAAALTSASSALKIVRGLDSAYARGLRKQIDAWFITLLSCASNPGVRSLDGVKLAKRNITDLSVYDLEQVFFWDAYWGEPWPQGDLAKSEYDEKLEFVRKTLTEMGLEGQSTSYLLGELIHNANRGSFQSAYELGHYYECRAPTQMLEIASSWFEVAEANAKDEDQAMLLMTRTRLDRLGRLIGTQPST